MKRSVSSSQKDVRIIQLTVDGDAETFGGEDQKLVESVSTVNDVVTVTLKAKAKARGGRAIAVLGMANITGGQKYTFTSSNTESVNFTTENTGVHGAFVVTLLVNDFRHIYEA